MSKSIISKIKESVKSLFSGKSVKFSYERYRGRLYGYAWVLLEKRDPEFDAEKMKDENQVVWVLKAMNFATPEEQDVINKLVESGETKTHSGNTADYMIGALEGKKIEYSHLSPDLLLKDAEVKDYQK